MRWSLVLLSLVGCIEADLVPCGNGLACRGGTTCVLLTDPSATVCATDSEIAACVGLDEGALCASGACHGGACIPIACGDERIDIGEVCDDGNTITGDGTCSSDCQSNETCGNGFVDPLRIDSDARIPNEQCDDGNLLSGDGCSSMCRLELAVWERIDGAPPALDCGSVAYDSDRGRTMLFGGEVVGPAGNVSTDALYEWTGASWIERDALVRPQARQNHAIAYDAARHRLVLFGGQLGNDDFPLGDTWEWDGTHWNLRSTTGPAARSAHTLMYDPTRKRVLLYGGQNGIAVFDDLWEWDGSAWRPLSLGGVKPPGRYGHVMAFDPVRGVGVVAGGYGPSAALRDTWELDADTWRQTSTAPGVLDLAGAMGFDAQTQSLVAYGTGGSPTVTRTYRYNGTWTDASSATPGPRVCHMIAPEKSGALVLFGGSNGSLLSSMYRWSGTAWSLVTPTPPPARVYAAVASDPQHGLVWEFGGNDTAGSVTGTLVSFDGAQWKTYPAGPSARSAPAMAYDRAHGELVLFGGIDGGVVLGDTWIFDGAWRQVFPAHAPSPRLAAGATYDSRRDRIVLFGGADNASQFLQDTWEWTGTDWQQVLTPTLPPPRMAPGFTFDATRGVVSMTHGYSSSLPVDQWTYDGTDWTLVSALTPLTTRLFPQLTYDPIRQSVVVFGGMLATNGAFNDTWTIAGDSFAQVIVGGPPPARGGGVAFPSPDGNGVEIHGGTVGVGSGLALPADVWRLTYDSDAPRELCTIETDLDGDTLAGCADPDCAAACMYCGDGTCSAQENCRLCPTDCACTAVCGDSFCDTGESVTSCPGDCTP